MMKNDILKIVDSTKSGRIGKICSLITRDYFFQERDDISNIIIPAKNQKDKIVVMAHHDVFPGSKGYNDNSTGVVILLWMQDFVPDNVEFVFTDGEERGGRGCNLYLEKATDIRFAINLDVVGLGNKIFYEEYGPKGKIFLKGKDLEYYKGIPFSDSYILDDYGIPNILMLTGSSSKTLIRDIFNAQHRGCNDGRFDLIRDRIMRKVFVTTLRIIKMNGGAE